MSKNSNSPSLSSLSRSPIPSNEVHIVFDLHGVLISKFDMAKKYDAFLLNFIHENFALPINKTKEAIRSANETWHGFWEDAKTRKTKPPTFDEIIAVYEETNAKWAKECFQGKFQSDYRQLAEFLEYFIPTNFCTIYSEVRTTLTELKNEGIQMSVASSAYTRHTFGVLAGCKLFAFFDKIIGLDNTKSLKSDVRYYQRTFEIINIPPEKCIFVGNSIDEVVLPYSLGARVVSISREALSQESISSDYRGKVDLLLPDLRNFKQKLLENEIIFIKKD